MTGTGTVADPYIIYTWDELLTTVVQTDVYIELGSDIDCKELGAITPTQVYNMNFTLLDGKEYSVKNLYLLNCGSVFSGVKSNTIQNLTFKNIYMSNVYALFNFDSSHPMYHYLPTFKNCHFSAECTNGSNFIDDYTSHLYSAVFRDCTFHILCDNSNFTRQRSYSDDRQPILLDNCVLELYGTFIYDVFSVQLVNSYVTGEVTLTAIAVFDPDPVIKIVSVGSYHYYSAEFMASNSIVDLIVHNGTGKASIPYMVYDNAHYADDVTGDLVYTTPTLFVNTEALEDFVRHTGYSGTFHECTSAQIHDEAYLRSEGFVAETIWDGRYVRKNSLNCVHYDNGGSGAYIDTGIINSSSRKTSVSWEYTAISPERWVMGAIDAYDWEGGLAYGTSNGTKLFDEYYGYPSYNIVDGFTYGIVGTKLHGKSNASYWHGYQKKYNMILNGRCYDGAGYGDIQRGIDGKIYRANIWETDNTPLRDFIPAYDTQNNEYGMYDVVNNIFYGSSNPDAKFSGGDEMPFKFVDGKLVHSRSAYVHKLGAFINSTALTDIQIPESVKKIGRYAFANTALSAVTISSDCIYYDTSFPDNCVISFYPD